MAQAVSGNSNSEKTLPYYPVEPHIPARSRTGDSIEVIGICKTVPRRVYVNSPRADRIPLLIDHVIDWDEDRFNEVKERAMSPKGERAAPAATPAVPSRRKADRRTSLATH